MAWTLYLWTIICPSKKFWHPFDSFPVPDSPWLNCNLWNPQHPNAIQTTYYGHSVESTPPVPVPICGEWIVVRYIRSKIVSRLCWMFGTPWVDMAWYGHCKSTSETICPTHLQSGPWILAQRAKCVGPPSPTEPWRTMAPKPSQTASWISSNTPSSGTASSLTLMCRRSPWQSPLHDGWRMLKASSKGCKQLLILNPWTHVIPCTYCQPMLPISMIASPMNQNKVETFLVVNDTDDTVPGFASWPQAVQSLIVNFQLKLFS